ncbi:hypothetical protein, partial [Burkholderia vietnamiensis]|uniref:hypothetical protein n=1 Tax=Burkholderia vietnamiensis TaxID=60552 RepID=UPI001ABB0A68
PAFVAYRIAATMQHGIYAPATLRFAFPHSLDPKRSFDPAYRLWRLSSATAVRAIVSVCRFSAIAVLVKLVTIARSRTLL